MIENPYYKRPAKIVLMGDGMEDETFRSILKKALSHQVTEMPEILSRDSEGAASKGVAEFAKRLPHDPYKDHELFSIERQADRVR